jgi:ankyrin repeat protein
VVVCTPAEAIRQGAEVLRWFDEAGARWAERDQGGQTLLHVVARHDTPRAASRCEFLFARGVDLTIKDGDGWTAVNIAAVCGNTGVLKLFEREGKEMGVGSGRGS